jgi:carbonic anhydrase
MDPLVEGYRRFRENVWPSERARYETLAKKGQRPQILVIACSDSRVDPQTIFGAGPGELFVVRNVGALVPPYQPDAGYHGTSAALEFGVRVLKVSRIVVLGHAQCGGVKALVEGLPKEAVDFLKPWMQLAEPALRPSIDVFESDDVLRHYEMEVVMHSLANLRTFPWIDEVVRAITLELSGFRFDIHTGVLMELNNDDFVAVT